jgi:hypothetical protein
MHITHPECDRSWQQCSLLYDDRKRALRSGADSLGSHWDKRGFGCQGTTQIDVWNYQ